MPRSFRPVRASLQGVGPLLVVEDTSELPWRLMVVTSYVDVPADWRGPSLERHLTHMQDVVIADLEKQGWQYEGGPFMYTNPFTRAKRYIPGGFAMQRTGVVTRQTDEGTVGEIQHTSSGPITIANGELRYLMAARYRKQTWKTELLLPEEDARGGHIR